MPLLIALMLMRSPIGGVLSQTIDHSLALQYFHEIRALSDADGGKLWGKPLYGPTFFVDRSSRTVVANQAGETGELIKEGDVFAGLLPRNIPIANTSVEWAGLRWTMVIWPPGGDQYERDALLAHELYHRLQPQLGLIPKELPNVHLDTLEGRYWLQLERRALGSALQAKGNRLRRAAADALLFRARRREVFPDAAQAEDSLEMNEGLAEYTGVRLSGLSPEKTRERASKRLLNAARQPSFVRSFAYDTGPGYGLLLDIVVPRWNRSLNQADSLSLILQAALKVKLGSNLSTKAGRRSAAYRGTELRIAEEARERDRISRIANYRRLLVDGPVLEAALVNLNFSFNPDTVVPLEGAGTVYPTLTASDVWGVAEANNGALISSDFKRLYLPLPIPANEETVSGEGWTLKLKPGWKVVPGKRNGDLLLAKSPKGFKAAGWNVDQSNTWSVLRIVTAQRLIEEANHPLLKPFRISFHCHNVVCAGNRPELPWPSRRLH
jgi:hypothetical protein